MQMNTKIAAGAALAAAALIGVLAVAYGGARSSGEKQSRPAKSAVSGVFSEAEETAIRAVVREFLIEHPEALVDALRAYSEREQAAAAAKAKEDAKARLPELLNEAHGFAAGADLAKAKVAVVELFDYHCAYCKRAASFVRDLTKKDPQVKVVFREFPILRRESDIAAELALAARAQGKYMDFHFALMDANGVLTRDRLKKIAESRGIDFAALEKRAADPDIKAAIEETHRIAAALFVDGTPTFIVASLDGNFLEIVPGADDDLLAAAIKAAKAPPKKSVVKKNE
jgi:protein-disulfide isomerase